MVQSQRQEDLEKAVEKLFSVENQDKPEELRFFLDRLHSSYSDAHRSMTRCMVTIPSVWLVAYAIREGVLSGGEIVSFKIEKVEIILLLAPALLGMLAYALFASAHAQSTLRAALDLSYKHLLPTAHELDLQLLLFPFSLIHVEAITIPRRPGCVRTLSILIRIFLGLLALLVPILGIIHMWYLCLSAKGLPAGAAHLSTMVGILFWLRGLILLNTPYVLRSSGKAATTSSGNTRTAVNPVGRADV